VFIIKSIQFEKYGSPLEVLKLVETENPVPDANQIRIKMLYSPINPSDVSLIGGSYGVGRNLPAIAGGEGVGVIDKIGENITNYKVGQRIIPITTHGKWTENIVENPENMIIVPVPDELEDKIAAQFLVNPLTAWIMTLETLNLKADEWLLQTAAGSTLGRMIIQISKLKGFKTVNLVRRREQVDELLALGADAVICTKDNDVIDQVMKITTKGVHGAIDAVGGTTGGLAASCLRKGGKLLVFGLLSGQLTPINTGEMIFKGSHIEGFWLSTWLTKNPPQKIQATFSEMIEILKNKTITPSIEAVYDIDDFKDALNHTFRQGRQGKILLKIS